MWDKSFDFSINALELATHTVVIVVMDWDFIGANDFLGRFALDPSSFPTLKIDKKNAKQQLEEVTNWYHSKRVIYFHSFSLSL